MKLSGLISTRRIETADAEAWRILRSKLWPHGQPDHADEIASFFAGTLDEPIAVFVAENSYGQIVGFAELSIRSGIPGLEGERVGYIEGMYVKPEYRNQSFGVELLRTSRRWGHEQNCTAFASDRADRVVIDRNF